MPGLQLLQTPDCSVTQVMDKNITTYTVRLWTGVSIYQINIDKCLGKADVDVLDYVTCPNFMQQNGCKVLNE